MFGPVTQYPAGSFGEELGGVDSHVVVVCVYPKTVEVVVVK
jgi:hypothetical protein